MHRPGRCRDRESTNGVDDPQPDRPTGKIAIRSEFLGSVSAFQPGRTAGTDNHKVGCALDLDFRHHTGRLSDEPLSTVGCLTLTPPRFGGNGKARAGSPRMNQSELIEKVAQATQLNQAAAGQAVKAVVNAILDALVAGDAVRVSGLGIFNVAARPAREGGIHKPEWLSRSQPARLCDSTQARPSRMPSIHRLRRGLPGRRLYHQRNQRCGSKLPFEPFGAYSSGTPPLHRPASSQRMDEPSEPAG